MFLTTQLYKNYIENQEIYCQSTNVALTTKFGHQFLFYFCQKTDHVIYQARLERFRKESEMLLKIKTRKLEYLGYIMTNNQRYEFPQEKMDGEEDLTEEELHC